MVIVRGTQRCCPLAATRGSCYRGCVTASQAATAAAPRLCMWNAGQAELTVETALDIKLKNTCLHRPGVLCMYHLNYFQLHVCLIRAHG